MNHQVYKKLSNLKVNIEKLVPESADSSNIWHFLGWDDDASEAYLHVKDLGLDLRQLVAPDFSDIVSIVVDGAFNFPYGPNAFTWNDILDGHFDNFIGLNAKERLLAVIDATLKGFLDS